MNFSFFKKLIRQSSDASLGIDIGTTSIKLVELQRRGSGIAVTNYGVLETFGYLERVNTALQASSLKLFEQDIVHYLKLLIEKTSVKTRVVIASLPLFSVFTTILELPPMPEKEIAQALQFKARQYIPLPISSVSLDFVRVAENRVLLCAIPNDVIEKYTRAFQGAGLTLTALEIEGVSIARALSAEIHAPHSGAGAKEDAILVIDIGSRSTGLFVVSDGTLMLVAQTDFSGASLTRGVASALGITMRRAEDLKKQRGLVRAGFGAEQELSTLIIPLLDVILQEAKRVQDQFRATYQKDIKKIILSGGGAYLLGLQEYVQRQFGILVEKAMPFGSVSYSARAETTLVPLGPRLTVALGAALRGITT